MSVAVTLRPSLVIKTNLASGCVASHASHCAPQCVQGGLSPTSCESSVGVPGMVPSRGPLLDPSRIILCAMRRALEP
jgi:hypothetical protein